MRQVVVWMAAAASAGAVGIAVMATRVAAAPAPPAPPAAMGNYSGTVRSVTYHPVGTAQGGKLLAIVEFDDGARFAYAVHGSGGVRLPAPGETWIVTSPATPADWKLGG